MRDFAAEALDAWKERALSAERQLAIANALNKELAAQIRMVMEERFYRPVVTGSAAQPPPTTTSAPVAERGDGQVLPTGALDGDPDFDPASVLWDALGKLKQETDDWRREREERHAAAV